MNKTLVGIGSISIVFAGVFLASCSKDSTPSSVTADKPSGVMGAISSAVAVAGTDMGKGGSFRSGARPSIDSECDSHSSPLDPTDGSRLMQSHADFPGRYFYCKMAKNTYDPDSVQGSFSMVKGIACMLEKAGLVFDGAAHTITATPDTTCFTQTQLTNMGTPASFSISVTASAPAAFNTYFAKGAVMQVPSFGTFKIASNVSGSNIEFLAMEDQSEAAGGASGTTNKSGTYAGSLNTSTGDLRFEARHDRFNGAGSGCGSGSCGWSRHARIYAKLVMNGTTPTGIVSISGAAAEEYANPIGGYFVSASGKLADGIKPLFFAASSPANANDLNTVAKYASGAGPNSRCYTSTSSTFTPCGSTGIPLPAGPTFPFTHTVAGTYATAASWSSAYAGMAFTAVDPSLDTQP